MKPAPFKYVAAKTLDEAIAALDGHSDAKVLAGGQSLVPMMNFRLAKPTLLVDINRIDELKGVRADSGRVLIGAMTRHAELERSALVKEQVPLISEAVSLIGHTAIRNRGTIGGSLSHADPAADLPVALLALDTLVHVKGAKGARTIAIEEFFVSLFTTAMASDEILTTVEVPRTAPGDGWAMVEFSRRQGDFALASVGISLRTDAGRIATVRIALGGVANHAIRAHRAERILQGVAPSVDLYEACAEEVTREIEPPSDIHGSAEYRKSLIRTLVRSGLAKAVERANSSRIATDRSVE